MNPPNRVMLTCLEFYIAMMVGCDGLLVMYQCTLPPQRQISSSLFAPSVPVHPPSRVVLTFLEYYIAMMAGLPHFTVHTPLGTLPFGTLTPRR